MAAFLDICRFFPTAGGTTDWTVSSAVQGYQTPASAGAVNGTVYRYRAESADLLQWEIGYGTYTVAGTVLARTTVLFNSAGTTAKISFSAIPQVAVVAIKEDLISIEEPNSFTATQKLQARSNIDATGRIKALVSSRVMTAASGNVAYTGLGFRPKALIFTGGVNAGSNLCCYAGMAESLSPTAGLSNASFGSSGSVVAALIVNIGDATNANSQQATVNSWDADGFTLAWSKVGTPTGTASLYFMCFE